MRAELLALSIQQSLQGFSSSILPNIGKFFQICGASSLVSRAAQYHLYTSRPHLQNWPFIELFRIYDLESAKKQLLLLPSLMVSF